MDTGKLFSLEVPHLTAQFIGVKHLRDDIRRRKETPDRMFLEASRAARREFRPAAQGTAVLATIVSLIAGMAATNNPVYAVLAVVLGGGGTLMIGWLMESSWKKRWMVQHKDEDLRVPRSRLRRDLADLTTKLQREVQYENAGRLAMSSSQFRDIFEKHHPNVATSPGYINALTDLYEAEDGKKIEDFALHRMFLVRPDASVVEVELTSNDNHKLTLMEVQFPDVVWRPSHHTYGKM